MILTKPGLPPQRACQALCLLTQQHTDLQLLQRDVVFDWSSLSVGMLMITNDVMPNEKSILGSWRVNCNGSNGASLDLDAKSDQFHVRSGDCINFKKDMGEVRSQNLPALSLWSTILRQMGRSLTLGIKMSRGSWCLKDRIKLSLGEKDIFINCNSINFSPSTLTAITILFTGPHRSLKRWTQ